MVGYVFSFFNFLIKILLNLSIWEETSFFYFQLNILIIGCYRTNRLLDRLFGFIDNILGRIYIISITEVVQKI